MMLLSILIPIYNNDSSTLIAELCRQGKKLGIPFQLIAAEDGSTSWVETNRAACEKADARHIALSHNVGRSAIRNKLADMAEGEWLLFLDCDMKIEKEDFVKCYVDKFTQENYDCIFCGGPTYWPRDKYGEDVTLHWTIGSQREQVAKRTSATLYSCNFCIRRDRFMQIRFNEDIVGYGHEDTLFGIMHKRNGGRFEYIDNGAVHLGLGKSELYLAKMRESIANLIIIAEKYLTADEQQQITALRLFTKLNRLHLVGMIRIISKAIRPMIERNLLGERPSLLLFDIYKVLIYSQQYAK